ncbi:MAG: hypothetical protein BAJALOKI2v1_40018 [Promethearchaeota archaeon]|nr:MAG: hypothetical protein BAJALOKI2v1_40018 [Candidatus Lokiarchaeota archaeon]
MRIYFKDVKLRTLVFICVIISIKPIREIITIFEIISRFQLIIIIRG